MLASWKRAVTKPDPRHVAVEEAFRRFYEDRLCYHNLVTPYLKPPTDADVYGEFVHASIRSFSGQARSVELFAATYTQRRFRGIEDLKGHYLPDPAFA